MFDLRAEVCVAGVHPARPLELTPLKTTSRWKVLHEKVFSCRILSLLLPDLRALQPQIHHECCCPLTFSNQGVLPSTLCGSSGVPLPLPMQVKSCDLIFRTRHYLDSGHTSVRATATCGHWAHRLVNLWEGGTVTLEWETLFSHWTRQLYCFGKTRFYFNIT